MPKISRVEYSALFNLGDYSNEKIGLVADLNEGEQPEEAIAVLRERAIEMSATKGEGDCESIFRRIWEARANLAELDNKIRKAQSEWNTIAEFLRTQGLKPDAPNLVAKMLPSSSPETESHQIYELEDEDIV